MKVFLRLLKLLGISILIFIIGGLALLAKTVVVWGSEAGVSQDIPDILQSVQTGEAINSIEDWESEKDEVIKLFVQNMYGAYPEIDMDRWSMTSQVLDPKGYNNKGIIEQYTITAPEELITLHLVLVRPIGVSESSLLLTTNFCGNHSVFDRDDIASPSTPYPSFCDMGEVGGVANFILGDMINSFPEEDMLDQGITFGTFYAGEIVPDEAGLAGHYLAALSGLSDTKVTGAISAWGWGYSLILDKLGDQFTNIAIYGHSRAGKAALWAAANDERIDAVIAHQSGTGGATLNQSHKGESIKSVTSQYPHWFDPAYASLHDNEDAQQIDQHHLIALIAPRPVLLGNAQLDKWSDPRGAFQAMKEASKVYDLFGAKSFNAKNLQDFHPGDALSYWFRSGPHGVRSSDWEAFLKFVK